MLFENRQFWLPQYNPLSFFFFCLVFTLMARIPSIVFNVRDNKVGIFIFFSDFKLCFWSFTSIRSNPMKLLIMGLFFWHKKTSAISNVVQPNRILAVGFSFVQLIKLPSILIFKNPKCWVILDFFFSPVKLLYNIVFTVYKNNDTFWCWTIPIPVINSFKSGCTFFTLFCWIWLANFLFRIFYLYL